MKKCIFMIMAIFFCLNSIVLSAEEVPAIAKWYNNYDAAISLRFDDTLDSHVKYVIPLLNKYGFQATFMINPGLKRYRKHKDLWGKVPLMGHRLGNHTMHHRGAKKLKEADYEIGEASRIIWSLYPENSKLLVFASGGGKKWGGNFWENASDDYKKIVRRYHLIDLYDGNHPSMSANSETSAQELCGSIYDAIKEKKYQPFSFHNIGDANIKDFIKLILRGYHLTYKKEKFIEFVKCLDKVREQVWVAPMVQILKYQEEYKSAQLAVVKRNNEFMTLKLTIGTDPTLYNQKLTIIVPGESPAGVKSVYQNNKQIKDIVSKSDYILINVEPKNSIIKIDFH